ncbi:MAG: aryl-sulfate sulfotransferase [Calditrichia bacterium]
MKNFYKLIIMLIINLFFTQFAFSAKTSVPYQYLSPVPGSENNMRECTIIIRPGEYIDPGSLSSPDLIQVTGTKSGQISGKLILSTDGKTVIFDPNQKFNPNEVINVKIGNLLIASGGNQTPAYEFSFKITATNEKTHLRSLENYYEDNLQGDISADLKTNEFSPQNISENIINDSLPEDFPSVTVNAFEHPSQGYLFVGFYRFQAPNFGPSFVSIIDNYGTPIFYKKATRMATDIKVQPNGLLTYFIGNANVSQSYFYAMDESYTVVDSFCTKNGYSTDLHELRILPNNHALLMSYDGQLVRMDTVVEGGNPNAFVRGLIIQELDNEKNVIFQWRSWDHFKITDADPNISLTDSIIDYVHGNALEVDDDGNILVSCRNMSEITKINRETGEIIWRWGGRNNQFTFLNDNRGFSLQHNIRRIDNGHYTLFDNGNYHDPQFSSALEYELDQQNMTATLVWSYRDSSIYSPFMGNVQRLENGNSLIGWGGTFNGTPGITEVSEDGTKQLELIFENPYINYRAFRFPWKTNLISTDVDTVSFIDVAQYPDTASFHLINNTPRDMLITTGSTRTPVFSVIDSLPILLPASGSVDVSVKFDPVTAGNINDVLTLRVDSENEGFGCQVSLIGRNDSSGIVKENLQKSFVLHQNYPNPFNPATTIKFDLPKTSRVDLKIYDILGKEVATLISGKLNAGAHSVKWNGVDMASGVYFYRLEIDGVVQTRKMMLMR